MFFNTLYNIYKKSVKYILFEDYEISTLNKHAIIGTIYTYFRFYNIQARNG